MKRYTMFLDWMNQHWKWLYYPKLSTDSTQSLSNYQWHFSQKYNKNFTICMETQKTPSGQSNLEKNKRSWRNQAPWLQTIQQSYSIQDSMVLAHKQKYRSMEQDRKPRDKPTHIWSPNLWQRRQEHIVEKREPLQ